MSTQREEAVKVAKRLGDSTFEVWSLSELESYIQAGYLDFVARTKALWDSAHVPDRHSPAYTTDKFTRSMVTSRRDWAPWVPSPGGTPSSNRGAESTLDLGLVSDPTPFLGDTRFAAEQDGIYSLVTGGADVQFCTDPPPHQSVLPAEVGEVERATWDGKRITAITPQEADQADSHWETETGDPVAYVLIQKGTQKILKRFRGPTAPADTRPYTAEVGILRGGYRSPDYTTIIVNVATVRINLTPFADFDQTTLPGQPRSMISTMYPYPGFTPTPYSIQTAPPEYGWPALTEHATTPVHGGPFGFARRIPGAWYTNGPFGIPKRWNPGTRNTRIDYTRRHRVSQDGHLELQEWDVRYLRFWALAEALDRDGPGQNKKLAKHYRDRYEVGVEMIRSRHAEVREGSVHVMGEESAGDDGAPLARLPTNFGFER